MPVAPACAIPTQPTPRACPCMARGLESSMALASPPPCHVSDRSVIAQWGCYATRVRAVTTIGSTLAGATTVKTPALRYWRSQAALRQSELAQRADVGEMSVRRGENGQPLQLA